MGWTCIGFRGSSIFDLTLELEHADVSSIFGKIEGIVTVDQQVFIGVEFAVVNPHSLRSKPVREVRYRVEQILVAITVAEGGLPGDQDVLKVVADVQAHLTIDRLIEKGVLALHWDISVVNRGSWSCPTRISVFEGLLIIDEGQVEGGFELVNVQLGLQLEDPVQLRIWAHVETYH